MAIKPTIFKFRMSLSDLNRDYYDSLNLTIAQHPSESVERMMTRVLAFCINAQENLVFTRGLSSTDEPDIWVKSLDEKITLWIDVGEPSADRVKKAIRHSPEVKIYSFNSKSGTWWEQEKSRLKSSGAHIYQFQWTSIQTLASFVERTMDFSITITGESAFIATNLGECEISWNALNT